MKPGDDPQRVGAAASTRPQRRPAAERRRELVLIAFRHIAERGLEGLRVRDVAAEAGINNATLHHYFPTKEDLIAAVVEYLVEEFRKARAPREPGREPSAWEMLRLEAADLGCLLREAPQLMEVVSELVARSRRDPAIAPYFTRIDQGWHGYLVQILRKGVREGAFRPDLDAGAAAALIMAQMKGIGFQCLANPSEADRLIEQFLAQLHAWLRRPPGDASATVPDEPRRTRDSFRPDRGP